MPSSAFHLRYAIAALAVVLLVLVGRCAADEMLHMEIVPSLMIGDYAYRVWIQCGTQTHFDGLTKRLPSSVKEIVSIVLKGKHCPTRRDHKLGIRMVNTQNWAFKIWPADFVKPFWQPIERNTILQRQKLTFGTHFHINIFPFFAPHSKMVYRVDIWCHSGGDEQERAAAAEFKGFTKGQLVVVMNSEHRKCANEQYDVNVWPVHEEWMDKNERLNQAVHVARGVHVANGAVHEIHFTNYFSLNISPSIAPNEDSAYFVEIKCQGGEGEKCQTYRTVTRGREQVVLLKRTEEKEGEEGEQDRQGQAEQQQQQQQQNANEHYYDILVWKAGKDLADNEFFPSAGGQNERKEIGVKIGNGLNYTLNWPSISNQKKSNSITILEEIAERIDKMERHFDKIGESKMLNLPRQMEELQAKVIEIKQQYEAKIEEISEKIGCFGSKFEHEQIIKQQTEEKMKELREEIAKMNTQREENFESVLNKMKEIWTEISEIKHQESEKQKLLEMSAQINEMNKEEMRKIYGRIDQLDKEIESIKQNDNEGKLKQFLTQIDGIHEGIAEIKQQNEEKILPMLCTDMATMKQEIEKKVQQITEQNDQLKAELANIKRQRQREKKKAMAAKKRRTNEAEGVNAVQNEVAGLKTTILELKQFLEQRIKET